MLKSTSRHAIMPTTEFTFATRKSIYLKIRFNVLIESHCIGSNAHTVGLPRLFVDKTDKEDSFIDVSERSISSEDWRFKISRFPYDKMTEKKFCFEQKRKTRFFVLFRPCLENHHFVSFRPPKTSFGTTL